jgi:hypothetical protein
VHGQEACGRLKVQRLRLRPDKICQHTNVSRIAVEESDPEHGVPRLEVLDVTANLFHSTRVLEAWCDRPAHEAAGRLVHTPADTNVRIVHPDGLGMDQDLPVARFWDRMRFKFELLVAPGSVNNDFAHEVLGRPPNCAGSLYFQSAILRRRSSGKLGRRG